LGQIKDLISLHSPFLVCFWGCHSHFWRRKDCSGKVLQVTIPCTLTAVTVIKHFVDCDIAFDIRCSTQVVTADGSGW